jgi:hypothetical protein
MASNLPVGWGDRISTMSEHDMKLGGAAATRFISSSSNGAYGDGTGAAYKSSDEVKAFYMKQIDLKNAQTNESSSSSSLPVGWEERQKVRQVEDKQYGAVSKDPPSAPATASSNNKPEVALVQVATHTLNALAGTLEGQTVSLPMEERAAFAVAMKRAMDALAKCS